MTEREELIEEYKKIGWGANAFVDWVIADRRRVVESLIKCTNMLKSNPEKYDIPGFAYKYAEAIGQTLQNAGITNKD